MNVSSEEVLIDLLSYLEAVSGIRHGLKSVLLIEKHPRGEESPLIAVNGKDVLLFPVFGEDREGSLDAAL